MALSRSDLWLACEEPERPLAYGACFCDCPACAVALEAAGDREPDMPIGIKFGLAERCIVDAEVLVADGFSADDLVRRFGEEGDWVREVWVAASPDDCMSPGERRLFGLIEEAGLPLPEHNVLVSEDGTCRPAGVRRVARTDPA